jgi:hypothetical protein
LYKIYFLIIMLFMLNKDFNFVKLKN